MFGGNNNNTTGFSFGSSQPQQQQQTGFGGFGTGGLRGGTSGTGGLFGQPAGNQSAFGQQPNTATGGIFGQSATNTTGFGQNTGATGMGFGATQPSTFGQPAMGGTTGVTGFGGGFGAGSTTTGFGAASSTPFGSTGAFQAQSSQPTTNTVNNGTGNPAYVASSEKESNSLHPIQYNSISCMPNYLNWSFEELRVLDYQLGKKGPQATANIPTPFGGSTSTTGGFGSGFGQTGTSTGIGFGQNTGSNVGTSSFGTGFGTQQPAATSSFPGFGQPASTNTGFGAAAPSNTGFGSTGLSAGFGNTATSTSGTGGFGSMFGTKPATSSPFGQPAASTSTTGFGFGLPATSTTGTTGFASGMGTFGNAAAKPSVFGGSSQPQQQNAGFSFGQSASNTTSGFGNTQTSFGTSGTTGFGFNQPQQPVTSTPASSFTFGNAANSNKPAFGFNQPTTSTANTGMFGQPATSSVTPSFGGFNQPQTSTAAAPSFSFGQAPQQSAFGGFGTSQPQTQNATTSGFGAGLLGQTSQPAPSSTLGNLFSIGGTSTAAPGALGGGLFSQNTTQPTNPFAPKTSTTSTGLFGPSTSSAQPSFSFGQSLTQQPQTQNTLFNPSQTNILGSSNLQQGNLTASIDTGAYGNDAFLQPSGIKPLTKSIQDAVALKSSKMPLSFHPKQATPKVIVKATVSPEKIKTSAVYSVEQGKSTKKNVKKLELVPEKKLELDADITASVIRSMKKNTEVKGPSISDTPLISKNGHSALKQVSFADRSFADESFLSSAFPTPKKLLNFDTPAKSALQSKPAPPKNEDFSFKLPQDKPFDKFALKPEEQENIGNIKDGDYYTIPSLKMLGKKSLEDLKSVSNFVIGRAGYGKIEWKKPVDLAIFTDTRAGNRPVKVEDIPVIINKKQCIVYPDEKSLHHERGEGLNNEAEVTLFKCWPVDKSTDEFITDEKHKLMQKQLLKMRQMKDTEFVSFNVKTGEWKFKVEHFSIYGLNDDEDDDEAVDIEKVEYISEKDLKKQILKKDLKNKPKFASHLKYRNSVVDVLENTKVERLRKMELKGEFVLFPPSCESFVVLKNKSNLKLQKSQFSRPETLPIFTTSCGLDLMECLFSEPKLGCHRLESLNSWFVKNLWRFFADLNIPDSDPFCRLFFLVLSRKLTEAIELCVSIGQPYLAIVLSFLVNEVTIKPGERACNQHLLLDYGKRQLLRDEVYKVLLFRPLPLESESSAKKHGLWYINLLLLLSGDMEALLFSPTKLFQELRKYINKSWLILAACFFYYYPIDWESEQDGSADKVIEEMILFIEAFFEGNLDELNKDVIFGMFKVFLKERTIKEVISSTYDLGVSVERSRFYHEVYAKYNKLQSNNGDEILLARLSFDHVLNLLNFNDLDGSLTVLSTLATSVENNQIKNLAIECFKSQVIRHIPFSKLEELSEMFELKGDSIGRLENLMKLSVESLSKLQCVVSMSGFVFEALAIENLNRSNYIGQCLFYLKARNWFSSSPSSSFQKLVTKFTSSAEEALEFKVCPHIYMAYRTNIEKENSKKADVIADFCLRLLQLFYGEESNGLEIDSLLLQDSIFFNYFQYVKSDTNEKDPIKLVRLVFKLMNKYRKKYNPTLKRQELFFVVLNEIAIFAYNEIGLMGKIDDVGGGEFLDLESFKNTFGIKI